MTEQHDPGCPLKAFKHSDAAKRLSDDYNLHRVANPQHSIGKWIAAALHDGSSDRTLYDSKRDAVRHQHHNEQWYTFVKIRPSTMSPCAAEVMLKVARMLYDKGMRLTDPDDKHGGRDVITRGSWEDQFAQAMGRNTNLILPWRHEK